MVVFFEKNKQARQGAKDSYYDAKNNPSLNWRILLYGMASVLCICFPNK